MILVRPRPISKESGRGYVLRVSEQNGLETPRWLLSYLGEKGIASKGYAALELILRNSEHGLDGLRGPVANLADLNAPDPGNLPIRYWNTRRPRFCPCCLAESPHWRASWDLVFTVACDKHGHQLHDRCPQCQKPLSWDRSHITTCPCGFDLREATTENAPEFAMQLAREIELRLEPAALPQAGVLKLWHRLDLETLLKLVWFLGAYSRNAHRKPQKIVGLETKLVAELMVEQAMAILSDWPAGFHRLLDEIAVRQAPAIASNKIGARFGGFYSALYKSFSGSEFEFLRSGFEDYLRERWTGQLARRNRRLSEDLRSEHGWVSIAEAAKQLKVRAGKVRQFLKEGLLEGQMHETKSGRQMGVVSRASLTSLVNHKQDWVTLKDARALLGMSRKRAYALLEQGVLKPISGPSVDGKTLWRFERQAVLAIAGAIEVAAHDAVLNVGVAGVTQTRRTTKRAPQRRLPARSGSSG